jgi:hypothetical protein
MEDNIKKYIYLKNTMWENVDGVLGRGKGPMMGS